MRDVRGPQCDRTREWLSLRLDGELSQLESALLAAHLAACAGCQAFAGEVEAVTAWLRAAPLVPLARPVAVPRPSRLSARTLQLAAAALVVAGVGLGGLVGALSSSRTPASPTVRTPVKLVAFQDNDLQETRAYRRAVLRPTAQLLWLPPRGLRRI